MSVWEHYASTQRRISSLNDMFSELGMKHQVVNRADSHLLDTQDHLTEKADALAVAFSNSTANEPADFAGLLQDYKDHLEYLRQYQHDAMELRHELQQIEWRLHMRTDQMKTIVLAASECLPPEIWLECSLPSPTIPSMVRTVEEDPVHATYNACKIEWRRCRQALINHENIHAEEATQRVVCRYRGQEIDLPEDQWIESYHIRRDCIKAEIESARRNLAESAAQCEAEGISANFEWLMLSLDDTRDPDKIVVSPAATATQETGEYYIDAFELKAREVDRVSIQEWVDQSVADPD
ncbi:hypothetical protein LTR10_010612 [Elasticomyces elasticus]|nr:hypothetical protein LTR10_010612 [Elasticomyces elasticus]KAK4968218.1 hypothetical protein LTR42_009501 [Elasticomyces elasticus]